MKQIFLVIVACGALLVACGGPEAKFIGTYDGDTAIPQEVLDILRASAAMAGENADEMIANMQNATSSMELKKGGVCIITSEFAGVQKTEKLTWSVNDDGTEISIEMEETEGSAAMEDMMPGYTDALVYAVSDDGKVLTSEDNQFRMKITYTRQ